MTTDIGPEARRFLLELARRSIDASLAGQEWPRAEQLWGIGPLPAEVSVKRGAFVTLRRRADHVLRGCIGRVQSEDALVQTVARMAVAAATEDPRFERVSLAELPDLRIEISALSAADPIRPEDVVVGTHGLIVRFGGRAGLLLPQVALEHGWSRDAFLEWVCRKAGLPVDTWHQAGCDLLGFTATVFGES